MQKKKKQVPNERTVGISRKKLNEVEASILPDTLFKTTVIRMLKELIENFNSMKKDIETKTTQK